MPELPEVQVVINYLNKTILNREIASVDVRLIKLLKNIEPKAFEKKLKGLSFTNIERRGKYLIFHLSNGEIMVSHLRMEGKYNFEEELELKRNDHIIYHFKDGSVLKYNDSRQFGTINIYKDYRTAMKSKELAKLGPEPFSETYNTDYLYKLTKASNRAIKTFLLDQTNVVGIGNIYANEICFAVKLNPKTPANKVTKKQCEGIVNATKEILADSIKHNGTTIHTFTFNKWEIGSYQEMLKMHDAKQCPTCHSKVKFEKVNGRGTYYCPKCQKGPK